MAETLVLIPGPMMDCRIFLPQMLAATGLMPIVLPCLKQTGTVEGMAEEVLSSVGGPIAVMGHGIGGMVAMEVLRRGADRVSRLVLIATDPLTDAASLSVAREAKVVQARAGKFEEVIAEDPAVRDYRARGDCDDLAETLLDMARVKGAEGYAAQIRALQRRPDQQRTLRQSRVPALVIGGGADPAYPARRQEFSAGLMRGARLEMVAGAGHLVTIEAPDQVNAALVAFLSEPLMLTRKVS